MSVKRSTMDVDVLHMSQNGLKPDGATSRLIVYAVAPATGDHVKVISSSLVDFAVANAGDAPGGGLIKSPDAMVTGLKAVLP